jgi:hypothetical protein
VSVLSPTNVAARFLVRVAAESKGADSVARMLDQLADALEVASEEEVPSEEAAKLESAFDKLVASLPDEVASDIRSAMKDPKSKKATAVFYVAAVAAARSAAKKHRSGGYDHVYEEPKHRSGDFLDKVAYAWFAVEDAYAAVAKTVGGAMAKASDKLKGVGRSLGFKPKEREADPGGSRTYQQYLEERAGKGPPLSKQEWEARYKHAGDVYRGNPNGQGIYPNEIDHGYGEPLAGGTDVMRRLQNQFLVEQGREPRPESPRLARGPLDADKLSVELAHLQSDLNALEAMVRESREWES